MKYPYLVLAGALIWSSCAHPVAPSGGPEDKKGPELLGYYPASGTLNSPLIPELGFKFSEWINPAGVGKVMVSPPLATELEVEISGSWLKVHPKTPLDSSTTYTFSLSNLLQDFHGNGLEKPFSLSLSTGSVIDSLIYQGRVLASDSSRGTLLGSTMVGLYPMGEERQKLGYLKKIPDSLRVSVRPSLELARYQVSPNREGFFEFQGLKSGHYRLFAFQDANGNGRYDRSEPYSFAEQDLHLPADSAPRVLPLSPATDSLQLLEMRPLKLVSPRDSFAVLQMNWNQEPDSLKPFDLCPVWDSSLACVHSQIHYRLSPSQTRLVWPLKELVEDSLYWLSGRGKPKSLRWRPTRDSLLNTLQSSTPISGFESFDPDSAIYLNYSQAIDLPVDSSWVLKFEDQRIPIQVKHLDVQRIQIKPLRSLPEQSSFRLWYKTAVDSSQVLRFGTWDPKQLASLQGHIDEPGAWTLQLLDKRSAAVYQTHVNARGDFKFDRILAGEYEFQYFLDLNGNGRRDPGMEYPFEFAESFVRLGQTLTIQPGPQNLQNLLSAGSGVQP